MPRKVFRTLPSSSPQVRGIQRHNLFQLCLGKAFQTVADFSKNKVRGLSREFVSTLKSLTAGCHPTTPVYVFKEVAVNRLTKQSRRADAIIYIPKCRIIYIEYKTIEQDGVVGDNPNVHKTQLNETLENIIINISYHMSKEEETVDGLLPITPLLVSRRFWRNKTKDDVITRVSHDNMCVREPVNPARMTKILSSMGRPLFK